MVAKLPITAFEALVVARAFAERLFEGWRSDSLSLPQEKKRIHHCWQIDHYHLLELVSNVALAEFPRVLTGRDDGCAGRLFERLRLGRSPKWYEHAQAEMKALEGRQPNEQAEILDLLQV